MQPETTTFIECSKDRFLLLDNGVSGTCTHWQVSTTAEATFFCFCAWLLLFLMGVLMGDSTSSLSSSSSSNASDSILLYLTTGSQPRVRASSLNMRTLDNGR